MITHLQHGDGCILTAAACVLDVTPLSLYESLGREVGSMVHVQELLRLLLERGARPTILERWPRFGNEPPLDVPFWLYVHRGVLCTESHAYAYDKEADERYWDPNGKWLTVLDPLFAVVW